MHFCNFLKDFSDNFRKFCRIRRAPPPRIPYQADIPKLFPRIEIMAEHQYLTALQFFSKIYIFHWKIAIFSQVFCALVAAALRTPLQKRLSSVNLWNELNKVFVYHQPFFELTPPNQNPAQHSAAWKHAAIGIFIPIIAYNLIMKTYSNIIKLGTG